MAYIGIKPLLNATNYCYQKPQIKEDYTAAA